MVAVEWNLISQLGKTLLNLNCPSLTTFRIFFALAPTMCFFFFYPSPLHKSEVWTLLRRLKGQTVYTTPANSRSITQNLFIYVMWSSPNTFLHINHETDLNHIYFWIIYCQNYSRSWQSDTCSHGYTIHSYPVFYSYNYLFIFSRLVRALSQKSGDG